MGFYIRKSLKVGPLRLNFSKSGVGVSAGVKGARIGVNARGEKYLHIGRGGFYYRQTVEGENADAGASWGVIALVIIALGLILLLTAR